MLQEETQVPVFFTHETPDLLDIYEDIKSSSNSDAAESATEGNSTFYSVSTSQVLNLTWL